MSNVVTKIEPDIEGRQSKPDPRCGRRGHAHRRNETQSFTPKAEHDGADEPAPRHGGHLHAAPCEASRVGNEVHRRPLHELHGNCRCGHRSCVSASGRHGGDEQAEHEHHDEHGTCALAWRIGPGIHWLGRPGDATAVPVQEMACCWVATPLARLAAATAQTAELVVAACVAPVQHALQRRAACPRCHLCHLTPKGRPGESKDEEAAEETEQQQRRSHQRSSARACGRAQLRQGREEHLEQPHEPRCPGDWGRAGALAAFGINAGRNDVQAHLMQQSKANNSTA